MVTVYEFNMFLQYIITCHIFHICVIILYLCIIFAFTSRELFNGFLHLSYPFFINFKLPSVIESFYGILLFRKTILNETLKQFFMQITIEIWCTLCDGVLGTFFEFTIAFITYFSNTIQMWINYFLK